VSTYREPVIGDDLDLETYGLPSAQRSEASYTRPRAHAAYDRSAARARRVNTHRPPVAERARGGSPRPSYGDDGVRTVKIGGNAALPARRASGRSLSMQLDRYDRRPDRAAQWALFMGIFMIAVAIVTGT
jgi:hypothetical protein